MSYILDFEKMRAGDIILTSGKSIGAKAIKLGTLCKYTHAMMYVGHTMIHAIPEGGVYSKNPQREILNKIDDALVLRLKSNISAENLKMICDHARNLSGTLYSKREAVLTKALSNKDADAKSKMQFCSRLVAQAYEFVGIRLVNNPSYCAPKDLFESNLLEPVENIVRPASPEEVDFANTPDPTLENQKLTYIWLEQARDIGKSLNFEIHSINDVFNFLNSHPESDKKICEEIKKSGYLEHYKCDCEINPYRYDPELFVSYFSNKNIGIVNAVMGEIKKEPGMINHMFQNYSAHVQLFKESNLEIHELHVELYKNILLLILQRVDVMKSAISSLKGSDLYSYIDNMSDVINRNITSKSR